MLDTIYNGGTCSAQRTGRRVCSRLYLSRGATTQSAVCTTVRYSNTDVLSAARLPCYHSCRRLQRFAFPSRAWVVTYASTAPKASLTAELPHHPLRIVVALQMGTGNCEIEPSRRCLRPIAGRGWRHVAMSGAKSRVDKAGIGH